MLLTQILPFADAGVLDLFAQFERAIYAGHDRAGVAARLTDRSAGNEGLVTGVVLLCASSQPWVTAVLVGGSPRGPCRPVPISIGILPPPAFFSAGNAAARRQPLRGEVCPVPTELGRHVWSHLPRGCCSDPCSSHVSGGPRSPDARQRVGYDRAALLFSSTMSGQAADTRHAPMSAAGTWSAGRLLTAKEAARVAGVHERTIRRAIARGELAATKRARLFQIAPEDLAQFQAQHQHALPPPSRLRLVEQALGPAVALPTPLTPLHRPGARGRRRLRTCCAATTSAS